MDIVGVYRGLAATTLVLLSGLGVLLATSVAPAAGDAGHVPKRHAFYTPPQPLAKAKPGTIIRSTPLDGAPAGARAWKILYHSRAVDGRDIAVSGVVIAPKAPAPRGGRVIVTYAHGFAGLTDPCAPSKQADIASGGTFTFNADGFISAIPMLQTLLNAGYVVAATDYEGLGTPGAYSFLVGESEGRTVLDAARAARGLKAAAASSRTLVFGHSLGGHAAVFAGELAVSYAPDLRVLGVAAEAPLTPDVEHFLPILGSVPTAKGIVVTIIEAFHAAYPQFDPAAVLAPDALAQASTVSPKCSLDAMAASSSSPVLALAHNPRDIPVMLTILHTNSAGNRPVGAPLLVAQGTADEGVPQVSTDLFVNMACAAGSTVDYRLYAGADHVGTMDAAASDVAAWFADRVGGVAAISTCG